ncbi:hypothetical protein B0J12DRAFT_553336, partial [Macrophomina phaseolina]
DALNTDGGSKEAGWNMVIGAVISIDPTSKADRDQCSDNKLRYYKEEWRPWKQCEVNLSGWAWGEDCRTFVADYDAINSYFVQHPVYIVFR